MDGSPMADYEAYGLGIRSAVPLPELRAGEAEETIRVRLDRVGSSGATRRSDFACDATDDEVWLFWKDVGAFVVRGGNEIVVDPAPGVDPGLLRMFILGPAMASLLRQRGLAVLHASSVSSDGEALAFLGASGTGKSTLAAAMHARGFQVVADDAVAIEIHRSARPMVLPAFPQLKLWPDSAVILGVRPETLPRVDPQREKRACPVRCGFADAPRSLRGVYVIAEGAEPAIHALRPEETLVELLRHSYGARSLHAVSPAAHFLRAGELARRVPAWGLKVPRSLSALVNVVRLLEDDLARAA